jgi:hypothetical protein
LLARGSTPFDQQVRRWRPARAFYRRVAGDSEVGDLHLDLTGIVRIEHQDVGWLHITVNDAWLADGLGTYLKPAEGSRMLVVEVTVTNVSNKSVNTLRDNILVDGLKGADGPKSDRVLILGEGSTTPDFQPGVTQDAALVWEVPAGSYAEGDPVVVRILDKSLSPGLLFAAAWTNPEETAHVAVELGDRGDRYLEAEDRS